MAHCDATNLIQLERSRVVSYRITYNAEEVARGIIRIADRVVSGDKSVERLIFLMISVGGCGGGLFFEEIEKWLSAVQMMDRQLLK